MTLPPKPDPDLPGVRAFLEPRSIAVIGASRQRDKVGGQVFHNLLDYGFTGPVYPVNPTAPVVQSVPAYPSVAALPGPVDLAIIAVPAAEVLAVARACLAKGVRALAVLSAGFGEAGAQGLALQAELLRLCRTAGVRLVGPNCLGLVNTAPVVRMNALFSPVRPPSGSMAFASQSGALGLAAIEFAAARGLGFSSFVSMGNKADISSNDLLTYWEQDPATDVVLLYMESFGNPRRFAQIAPRVARTKPVLAVKSGRSMAGQRAAASHTGALLAASDITVDALFRQAGVVRVDTLKELFDVASLLAHQPLPVGRNVGIVTNVGGPAIMCADACEAHGLRVPELSTGAQQALRALLPPAAGVRNPVDMIATATASQFQRTIGIVAADPQVDALVVIFIPPLTTQPAEVAAAIHQAVVDLAAPKPVTAVFMTPAGAPAALQSDTLRIPAYPFPEEAAIALARAVQYAEWRAQPVEAPVRPEGTHPEQAAAILELAQARGGGWLSPEQTAMVLDAYGIPQVAQRFAATPEAASAAARALGEPVVLKAIAPGLLHKTDAGGVKVGLHGGEVAIEAAAMDERLAAMGHPVEGYVVQRQIEHGVELLCGVVHDPHFGPLIACGAGGVLVELLGDLAVRLAPLTPSGASAMLRGLRCAPLLTGYRGSAPVDIAAVANILLRVSALAEDLPAIAELDCNPILATPAGAWVADARIRVESAPAR